MQEKQNFEKVPTLQSSRLTLRGIGEEHAADYEKHFVDYEVISHLRATVPWPYPAGGILDYIKTKILPKQGKDKWLWGIFLKSNPEELIGVVDLWRNGTPENRGFWLGREFWGQGIMTEAVTVVMDYAFTELGFEKLIFSNALGNERSRRIKEKTGARLVGVEAAQFVNPKYSKHEIWELTKEDWQLVRSEHRGSQAN